LRDGARIDLYGVYIIMKQEMLLCHEWELQRMEGRAHTACAEGLEAEWNKFIILLWLKYFKLP
jgi:hypothetical protein